MRAANPPRRPDRRQVGDGRSTQPRAARAGRARPSTPCRWPARPGLARPRRRRSTARAGRRSRLPPRRDAGRPGRGSCAPSSTAPVGSRPPATAARTAGPRLRQLGRPVGDPARPSSGMSGHRPARRRRRRGPPCAARARRARRRGRSGARRRPRPAPRRAGRAAARPLRGGARAHRRRRHPRDHAGAGFNGKAVNEQRSFVGLGERPSSILDHPGRRPASPTTIDDGGHALRGCWCSSTRAPRWRSPTTAAAPPRPADPDRPRRVGARRGGRPATSRLLRPRRRDPRPRSRCPPPTRPSPTSSRRGRAPRCLVSDLWYTRVLDPRLAVTGLTRNGLWLIEDGEITTPKLRSRR